MKRKPIILQLVLLIAMAGSAERTGWFCDYPLRWLRW